MLIYKVLRKQTVTRHSGSLAVVRQILWRRAIRRFVRQNCVIVVTKAVLEKTLDDVKQAEEKERDSYALMRLSQRRQVVEQKLTRVRQQLADSSKVAQFVSFTVETAVCICRCHVLLPYPVPCNRQHLNYDVCLEVRVEIIRTVLCCIVY